VWRSLLSLSKFFSSLSFSITSGSALKICVPVKNGTSFVYNPALSTVYLEGILFFIHHNHNQDLKMDEYILYRSTQCL
jgi:hypothetical protein